MNIEITKKQEIVDDVPKEPIYNIYVSELYGSGYESVQSLLSLSRETLVALRDRLVKDFPLS